LKSGIFAAAAGGFGGSAVVAALAVVAAVELDFGAAVGAASALGLAEETPSAGVLGGGPPHAAAMAEIATAVRRANVEFSA
jgi:hypothetical protein